ncbi:MAG: hypothetical protein KKA90_00675 [Nanoarchaeota archaeon]|nr:hypothetical protein [Nanoarchaeota archaeon]
MNLLILLGAILIIVGIIAAAVTAWIDIPDFLTIGLLMIIAGVVIALLSAMPEEKKE